ncbi:MAG: hypothetical protein AAEJ46_03560 [Planctomycetota bacterium]
MRMTTMLAMLISLLICCPALSAQVTSESWINWESPPVHPLELVSGTDLLLATNTADSHLEIYNISSGVPEPFLSVPVGLDPVSVRARNATEAWVVNRISDTISIVDLQNGYVRWTLMTADEPADVIFAGTPERAYVSCSGTDEIMVFDPSDVTASPEIITLIGEEPRALAKSPDGSTVYCAIFESGNGTTVLGGGFDGGLNVIAFPPNIVSDPAGPYGGVNPPPNANGDFEPPLNPSIGTPPPVALIVKKIDQDVWVDDNGSDWGDFVSGPQADLSGRQVGWDLADHDVAVIDTTDNSVTYIQSLMNICMAIGVRPTDGAISVVGTEAFNHIRYEHNLNGHFIDVLHAMITPGGAASAQIEDLNPHLPAGGVSVPPDQQLLSIGDPRAIVWNAAGTEAFVAGKGSGNVVRLQADGTRNLVADPIDVGAGATGLALDESRGKLYVLEHFDASVASIDIQTGTISGRVTFHDPTGEVVRAGQKFLYDTHLTSGMGQVSCASCHVDARTDRLAWDLGDPAGEEAPFVDVCNMGLPLPGVPPCDDFHPMKGPMLTQTLQDIIGKEPHHWRGDKFGIEAFGGAFMSINGDDLPLGGNSMQDFEAFLASIYFPPNPFRGLRNELPTALPLDGHYTTGRFGSEGESLGPGNAVTGLDLYRNAGLDGGLQCVTCHALPIGIGPNSEFSAGFVMEEIPDGPMGEKHHGMVSVDGSAQRNLKIPQLRNVYKRSGFNTTQLLNTNGFGFLHDGSVDSVERFISEPAFSVINDQQIADLTAFMLAFSGSDLPDGSNQTPFEPLGSPSQDSHAAVGMQITFDETNRDDPQVLADAQIILEEAGMGRVGVIAKAWQGGFLRGWVLVGAGTGVFQSDILTEGTTFTELLNSAEAGAEVTFTVVPTESALRMGIDRDLDGHFDGDERLACSDPADALSQPGSCSGVFFVRGDGNGDGSLDISDAISTLQLLFGGGTSLTSCEDGHDSNDDGSIDVADPITVLTYLFSGGAELPAPGATCGEDLTGDTLQCMETVCP